MAFFVNQYSDIRYTTQVKKTLLLSELPNSAVYAKSVSKAMIGPIRHGNELYATGCT